MTGAGHAPLRRHFTATGFVVWAGRVLLHWHRKERAWFPPGGHVEADEDPVACVLREIEEESGIRAEVVMITPQPEFDRPRQLTPPVTILLEDVGGAADAHQHIDLIYFCRPLAPPPARFDDPSMRWVSASELETNPGIVPPGGRSAAPVPADVRVLALDAIQRLQSGAL